ncbi:MBL fold metallo-hydrolase [Mangrovihabitans endophyticus]|uniref:MBL fold metallo-hydrolase n=1 Tax=Mangrovihabitans endophyticus TaxID=1751298 RepID=A0A8J3C1A9_9ACTN|nr:MBL fold metallo-hydrolase [Mangrovihabitans endophyticus]GGL04849.1 MBL fold metallo-hydrolase [Mangrovihabitans endophyticus]
MRTITVLGSCGAFPEPDRACSGFLIEWDGFRLVLDLGYGTLPRLLNHRRDGAVDAVVVTHEHPDHCIDLHGLFRLHRYGGAGGDRIPLFCPPGVLDRLAGLEPDMDLGDVFQHRHLPGVHRIGPFELHGIPLPHHVPNAGVRLTAQRTVLAYTGDTGPDPALATLGRDADLFIVECTDRPGEAEQPHRNLMTAEEAGLWAARARARRLMLTHFWPGNDRRDAVRRARQSFDGPVLTAEEGTTTPLA